MPAQLPDFLPQTKAIREGDWKIALLPKDLLDRRTEITGPVERKMMINALNSGAKSFMADFEDSNCPTWENQIEGQINVFDAYRRQIAYTSPEGKGIQAERRNRNTDSASARLAPDGKTRQDRRRNRFRFDVRLWPVVLPQHQVPG